MEITLSPARRHAAPLIAALTGALLTFAAGPATATFKCVDDKGVTHYGDPLPAVCATKELTELSKQGTVKSRMERPLTAEEIKAREEDLIRRKDEIRRDADQQRRDRALVATYGAEREFDVSRDKAIEAIDARWRTANLRLKELDSQAAKLNSEMEFYQAGKSKTGKGKEAPAQLVQSVDRAKKDRETVHASMLKMEEEKKTITAQFEMDKQRWIALKTGKAVLQAEGKTYMPVKQAGEMSSLICNGVQHKCRAGSLYACRTPDSNGRLRVTMMACN